MEKRIEAGKFMIEIERCENATWQGTATWTDKNISQHFRSALELIKLIDSALAVRE